MLCEILLSLPLLLQKISRKENLPIVRFQKLNLSVARQGAAATPGSIVVLGQ
jgi:hypothetical protein